MTRLPSSSGRGVGGEGFPGVHKTVLSVNQILMQAFLSDLAVMAEYTQPRVERCRAILLIISVPANQATATAIELKSFRNPSKSQDKFLLIGIVF